jgi:hypothetical protein
VYFPNVSRWLCVNKKAFVHLCELQWQLVSCFGCVTQQSAGGLMVQHQQLKYWLILFSGLILLRGGGGGWVEKFYVLLLLARCVSLWCQLHKDVVVLRDVMQNLHTVLGHAPQREFLPCRTVSWCFMWYSRNIYVLVQLSRIGTRGLLVFKINFDALSLQIFRGTCWAGDTPIAMSY